MAKLVVTTQGLAGLRHEVAGSWVTIGRGEQSGFQIVEGSISGRHCEVRLRGDELVVRDLGSTNGTFAQGLKITEAVLKPGQVLRVGDVEMRFETEVLTTATGVPFTNTMLLKGASPKPARTAAGRPQADNEPAKKYQVLFVDDSSAFLETFGELCTLLSNQTWQIHSAMSADRALTILQQHQIDLAVVDIGMPLVDGLQLLGIIGRRFPGVKLAVMTGLATETNRATGLASGAELFIEKPLAAGDSRVVFNLLDDLVCCPPREGFSGTLRQVGLQEVIQMECTGRRSVILEIRNQQMRGQIYIEIGVITHAEVGELMGDKALNQLLSLTGGEFQLKPFHPPPQRTVQECWEMLLMEAARFRDEETAMIAREPADRTIEAPAADPAPVVEVDATMPDDEFVVVATYDGQWSPVADGGK